MHLYHNNTFIFKQYIFNIMIYSIEPRNRVLVKGYGFLSFAKSIGKNLTGKYRQRLLHIAEKSAVTKVATDTLKTT